MLVNKLIKYSYDELISLTLLIRTIFKISIYIFFNFNIHIHQSRDNKGYKKLDSQSTNLWLILNNIIMKEAHNEESLN